jgi:hypothetical protein
MSTMSTVVLAVAGLLVVDLVALCSGRAPGGPIALALAVPVPATSRWWPGSPCSRCTWLPAGPVTA